MPEYSNWLPGPLRGVKMMVTLPESVVPVTYLSPCFCDQDISAVTLLRGILSSCQTCHSCQLTWTAFSIFWMNISHQSFTRSSLHSSRTPSHSLPHSYPSSRPSSHPNLGNGMHKPSYHRSSASSPHISPWLACTEQQAGYSEPRFGLSNGERYSVL